MNEANAKLQEPFRAITREMHGQLEATRDALEAGTGLAEHWPALREEVTDSVLPTFKSWIKQLRGVIQPRQLKALQKHKRALERLVGKTWWHPRGLYLRLRIMGYGITMGLIIMLLLVLGVGLVFAVVYVVSLIMNRG